MPLELVSNNATSTVSGSVDAVTNPVSVTILSAALFPASGNFSILIDSEIMKVTAVAGNVLTCARAQEGTTIATHANGATVTHLITADSLKRLISEYHLSDTNANRPAAGVAGRVFFPSDGGVVWRDTGSAWECWVHGVGPFTPPISDFSTWVNQSSAGFQTTGNVPLLYWDGTMAGGENLNLRVKSLISAPWTFKLAFSELRANGSNTNMGPCLRDSGTGRIRAVPGFALGAVPATTMLWKWDNPTTFNGLEQTDDLNSAYAPLYMVRVRNDGTDYFIEMSDNWINWSLVRKFAVSGDFATWNQIGYYINAVDTRAGQRTGMTVYHASLEAGA